MKQQNHHTDPTHVTMAPASAKKRLRRRFGTRFWALSLDATLGLRMLRKQWGLTLVAGLAMTVAMGIGAAGFEFLDAIGGSTLPLDEGDQVVVLQTWDAAARSASATSPRDFERWRDGLRSVQDVGAFRTVERTIVAVDGSDESVAIAEMTAAGFELARTAPVLGRVLVENDERVGEDPVVVIGHDFWQSRFGGDPDVLGRQLTLGRAQHTIVGVMPRNFGFPVNHRLWVPLRADPASYVTSAGPEDFVVFARLARGATLDSAGAELGAVGLLPRLAGSTPAALQPRIVPYAVAFVGNGLLLIPIIQALLALFLVPPCVNIAILIYSRMLTRRAEFAARAALGATRGRIVLQLFVETLLLAAGAGVLALVLARAVGWRVQEEIGRLGAPLPFWMNFDLSLNTAVFVAGLVVLAALIASIAPALRATGGHLHAELRGGAGRSGAPLGKIWNGLVIAQVAVCLAVLPWAAEISWGVLRPTLVGPGFAAEQVLTARLTMDRAEPSSAGTSPDGDQPAFASRLGRLEAELIRQLEVENGVARVTIAANVPSEQMAVIEIDGAAPLAGDLAALRHRVRLNRVDGEFFSVFDAPILVGRGFESADFARDSTAAIVNRTFARDLFGAANPLGQRFRYSALRGETTAATAVAVERQFEIVGVVADVNAGDAMRVVYHPAEVGQVYPASLAIRVELDRAHIADRLRKIAGALDPDLRVEDIRSLDQVYRQRAVSNNLAALVVVAVNLSIVLLSAAGMYALMSFTVNERRREIGIRSALGAHPRRLLGAILKRAGGQLAAGGIVGVVLAVLLGRYLPSDLLGGSDVPGVIPAAMVFMIFVGLAATAGPARRALRVEPAETLRDGG